MRSWEGCGVFARRVCRALPLLALALSILMMVMPPEAKSDPRIWYSPDNDTPDFTDLFTAPDKWRKARPTTTVFKLGPQQLELDSRINSFLVLKAADAFNRLRSWGMKLALEEGALKEWDCNGPVALSAIDRHLANLASANAVADFIAFDSPLLSGIGPCHLTLDEAARRTAAVAIGISGKLHPRPPEIGIIEPFPRFRLDMLKRWIQQLKASGFKPDFLHVDIDMHYVNIHPELPFDSELRELFKYLHAHDIRIGFIIWSGYDPLSSDKSYYSRALNMAERVRAAVPQPDEVIIQSWITRAPIACVRPGIACSASCSAGDPVYCQKKEHPPKSPGNRANILPYSARQRGRKSLFRRPVSRTKFLRNPVLRHAYDLTSTIISTITLRGAGVERIDGDHAG